MGLFSVILNNGTELSLKLISLEFEQIFVDGELVEKAYRVDKDVWIFTNKRLFMVNKVGLRGSKVECLTLPYKDILRFSKETVGLFNKHGELRLWIRGAEKPLCKLFNKEVNINDVYQALSKYTLKYQDLEELLNTSMMPATLAPTSGSQGFSSMFPKK